VHCNVFFPRKKERTQKEQSEDAPYINVDHRTPISAILDNGSCLRTYCDGEVVWEGQDKEVALLRYNNLANLQFMCNQKNSSKGGKQNYDKFVPVYRGTHQELCNGPHTEGRVQEVR
jgi:hypothetical protein